MKKPLCSFVLFVFNDRSFVIESLRNLLQQDYPNYEIVISDNCSTDGTWEALNEFLAQYEGPIPIRLYQNSENLGPAGNVSAGAMHCLGELIFLAGSDDLSSPDRMSKVVEVWENSGRKLDLISSDAYDMSLDGQILGIKRTSRLQDWTIQRWFKKRPYFLGVTFAATARLLGLRPMSADLAVEDQPIVARSLLMGGGMLIPEPLVYHRRGGMSMTNQLKTENVRPSKRQRLLRATRQMVIEAFFLRADAELLGKKKEVDQLTRSSIAAGEYSSEILSGCSVRAALSMFFFKKAVPIDFRFRYLAYLFFGRLFDHLDERRYRKARAKLPLP